MPDKQEVPMSHQEQEVKQPGLRFLEAAVYIMGGLLVLMLLGLIGGILWKATHRTEPPPPETQLMSLGLAAGTEARTMTLDGDRLAINTGSEIIVVDIRKNAVLSRISLGPK
jgi:hypothetical protein